MSILTVTDLSKRFGAARALDEVSFSLEQGEVLAVIGSSGSGKTTLLRCLNGLETPDSGRIVIGGEPLFDSSVPDMRRAAGVGGRRRIGLVFQSFHLFSQYTVLQNVMLAPLLHLPRSERRAARSRIAEEAHALLRDVGLSDFCARYPHELSGGQQQRVAIARALALRPDILCFDEPTSALDPALSGEVLRVIGGLSDAHMTMIVVTHELLFAERVSTRVLFMDEGRIDCAGTPEEIFHQPKTQRLQNFINAIL